jgi:hypothetical protein
MWRSFPEYGNIFETAHTAKSVSVQLLTFHVMTNSSSSDIQMQTKHREIAKYRKLCYVVIGELKLEINYQPHITNVGTPYCTT